MKALFLALTVLLSFGFTIHSDCGDGKVYANLKQTEFDKRFVNYEKINGIPKYKGGEKKLDKLVRKTLKLSGEAKGQIFNLNYQFTVTCEGKIKDVKQIGDPRFDDLTNIREIIQGSEANWTPANHKGIPVDCVYFNKVMIVGSNY